MLPSPTASPAWLANGELGLKCAEGPDQFLDLALTATHAARWLDRNRISGSPENLATARRALALFTSLADLSLLAPPLGAILTPIRVVTLRLQGLIE